MNASAWAGHRQQQRHSYTREHVHIGQSCHELVLVQASRSDEHIHAMSWCMHRAAMTNTPAHLLASTPCRGRMTQTGSGAH